MKIFIIILLIIVGVLFCFVLYPIVKKKQNLMKNTKVTTVARLIQKFEQMTILDQGDTYTEYVALIGKIKNKELITTPFTKRTTAYCNASASIIVEKTELIKDDRGFNQTKITKIEKTIFNKRLGDKLELVDSSTPESVVLEIGYGGCKMDIPTTLDKEVSSIEFELFNLNIDIPQDLVGNKVLGYKVKEDLLDNDSLVYVVGEARKSGGKIHICLARDLKKPFIVTSKQREEFLNDFKDNSYLILILGIIFILVGFILIFLR